MKHKESRFNITISNDVGAGILYNTNTGKYVVLSQACWDIFKNILQGKIINDTVEAYLIENGFWINPEADETEALLNWGASKELHVTIMPTMACNFRCPYCFEEHISQRMTPATERAVIKYLSSRLKDYRHLHIQWYGGEPLLEMGIINRLSSNIIQLCRERNVSYTASMTTNGFFLSWNNYVKLKAMRVRSYAITIDGIQQDHDQTRIQKNGDPSFDTIIKNLKVIRDNDRSFLTRIIIRTNFTTSSIRHKNEWEQYLRENFLFDRRFKYMPRYAWDNNKGTYDKNQYIHFDFNDNVDIVDRIEVNSATSTVINDSIYTLVEQRLKDLIDKKSICIAGQGNSITIAPDGNLIKCQVLLGKAINIVGNINSANGDIVTYPDKIAYWEKRDGKYSFCDKCQVYPLCLSKGCAAKTGELSTINEQWCNGLKNQINKYLMILSYKPGFSDLEKIIISDSHDWKNG